MNPAIIIIYLNDFVKHSSVCMIIFVYLYERIGGSTVYYYQRLRDLREDRELKQKAIAEILDITSQQYSLYERGDREIPFHHAITLAKFYNVSLDYIAGLTNNKKRQ